VNAPKPVTKRIQDEEPEEDFGVYCILASLPIQVEKKGSFSCDLSVVLRNGEEGEGNFLCGFFCLGDLAT
jgi:hypothetical protein